MACIAAARLIWKGLLFVTFIAMCAASAVAIADMRRPSEEFPEWSKPAHLDSPPEHGYSV